MSIKDYKVRFEKIEELDIEETDIYEFEEMVYKLEEEVQDAFEASIPSEEKEFREILKKIGEFKKENNFYDSESELNNMFPNRGDDDFDEESTSYENVFGKD